jgi:hypothetical protein
MTRHCTTRNDYKYAPQSFENTWVKNNTRDMDYDLRNRDEYNVPPFIRIEQLRRKIHSVLYLHGTNFLTKYVFNTIELCLK